MFVEQITVSQIIAEEIGARRQYAGSRAIEEGLIADTVNRAAWRWFAMYQERTVKIKGIRIPVRWLRPFMVMLFGEPKTA